ncbi:histone-lysine N-methyltransferase EZA1-like [Dorcoceras hygrometricum]|uniref:Histone-lysine N-methyltransferase EZA1-like n=1 Tax=Dorcoceras hygrometricum TaxID=472368 RepID=A0A2Z7C4C4_9LAMI|nr:histone-lysine N-methyltransferase EZA1-like [Dorcoceras hygrometricum]
MAQYQILARNPFGPPETGPKQTLEVKNSVATPPRDRCTAAHSRLHSVRHRAARCACHSAQLVRTVAATYACHSAQLVPGSGQIHRETGTSRLAAVDLLIRSKTGNRTPSSVCTRRAENFDTNGISTTSDGCARWPRACRTSGDRKMLVVCASCCARWPTGCRLIAPPCCSSCALVTRASRRWLRAICARRCVALGAASCAPPPRFCGDGAAGRPPLRRSSGDIVTADFF